MGRYLIRRAIISVFTLIAISMVVYTILAIAPGDPLSGFANNPNVPPELRERIRKTMGLDDPIHVQYLRWASAYVQGDWLQSYSAKIPVRDYVMSRLPTTLMISGSAFVLSILVAVPIGVLSAIKQYSLFDQTATTFAFLGFSIPTFFSGILLILVFSVFLGWLPFVYDSEVSGFWPNLKQSIMPITVLGLAGAAQLMRFVRASMLETISQDYVRTARAKGLREKSVVVLHAMRNALIPVVTVLALQVPEIFGGAIITEQIFRIPGIGRALIDGIYSKDVPVVMAITFGIAVLVVLFNVIADILYAVLDPRIRYS
ncbi:MAG TPA: ABC transporter permease [Thermomicrobiales bacterium]|nr:ABC transporter permease [Thermomicrobiales bacterium]